MEYFGSVSKFFRTIEFYDNVFNLELSLSVEQKSGKKSLVLMS